MKLIDYYIGKTILSAIILVTLMLVGLQIFILFVDQLDSIGRGDFNVFRVFIYILLRVPYQVYLFFPVASLLGSLIGLGILANNSELIVMRASGYSIVQIFTAVLKAALILIVAVTLLGEILVPKMSRYAEEAKANAISGGGVLATARGVWFRDQDSFIRVGTVDSNQEFSDIDQYEFNADRQLVAARHADQATHQGNQWTLYNVRESDLNSDNIELNHYDEMHWDVNINVELLEFLSIEPEEMSLIQLHDYIASEQGGNSDIGIYEISYWKRIVQPLATSIMMLLAIPFIFGPLRSATMGSRLLSGMTVGFGFYMLDKFFGPFSLVYQVPPIVGAIFPSILFALIGVIMMSRVK